MNLAELNKVANAMVAPGKGILAADESSGTIKKRFDAIKVESTEDSRRDYREMMFRAKDAMTKATSFAEDNVKAALDLAQKLVRAKDVQEILALQTAFAKSQIAVMQTQAKELGAMAQEPVTDETKN